MTTNMTADGQVTDQLARSRQGSFFLSGFFLRLLAIALVLLTAGASGLWYLMANSPLTLLAGGDRPIAMATAFIPNTSPLTLSLLTRPDKLVALQQAMVTPEQRQQALREVEQIKQSITNSTGLDYDRDIQPWIGNEVTFAFTEPDLDLDHANGEQPGYLLVIEIAGDRAQQAREFLQVFWQRQSLGGILPISERVSGVRLVYSEPDRDQPAGLTTASALVGNRFVIFANDVRALKRSIRAAQSATNLAQNKKYRQAVAQLSQQRLGLAYLDTTALGNIGETIAAGQSTATTSTGKIAVPNFIAIGLSITNTGILANARLPMAADLPTHRLIEQPVEQSIEALKFLPGSSTIALASYDLSQLAPVLSTAGIPSNLLPDFLHLDSRPSANQPAALNPEHWAEQWNWASGDYALGRVGAGRADDWILAVERKPKGINQLDEAALAQGYSAVPVALGETQATAWTRFSARTPDRQTSRGLVRSLESELLALHLQQEGYEIFASSLAALESALDSADHVVENMPPNASQSTPRNSQSTPQSSLLANERFTQAIAPLMQPNNGYFYVDWPAIAHDVDRTLPIIKLIEVAAQPFVSHIDTLAATRDDNTASLFVQLTRSASGSVSGPASGPASGPVSKVLPSTSTYSASS